MLVKFHADYKVGVLVDCVTELGGSVAATGAAAAPVGLNARLHGWCLGSKMKPIKSRSKGLLPPFLSLPSSPSNPPMSADSKHV